MTPEGTVQLPGIGDVPAHGLTKAELRREIEVLLAQLDEKDAVLLTLQSEKSDLASALARQRRDFSSLEEKYLRLVRPARSSAGKHVATVRYDRIGGSPRITFVGVAGEEGVRVSKAELHRRVGV